MMNGCDLGEEVWKRVRSLVRASPNVLTKPGPTWASLGAGQRTGRGSCGRRGALNSRVMAHGLEDGIVKLDGAGNEQSRMSSLGRHFGRGGEEVSGGWEDGGRAADGGDEWAADGGPVAYKAGERAAAPSRAADARQESHFAGFFLFFYFFIFREEPIG